MRIGILILYGISTTTTSTVSQQRQRAVWQSISSSSSSEHEETLHEQEQEEEIDHGNHNLEWEDGPALNNWKKREMVRRYADAEATMGEARLVGETGPDQAGKNLHPTTVKDFITKHMYNPLKYFFDRKIAIPKGMLEDCHPFPMPTRAYLANPHAGEKYAPSKKRKVRTSPDSPDREIWRDHLAISIGSDTQGLTFHHRYCLLSGF